MTTPNFPDVSYVEWHGAYTCLTKYGHSPQKSAEIILDAKRGDLFAEQWLAFVRNQNSGPASELHPARAA